MCLMLGSSVLTEEHNNPPLRTRISRLYPEALVSPIVSALFTAELAAIQEGEVRKSHLRCRLAPSAFPVLEF